jgi:D-psicose/D-tagatose/L-ribulose 3-epimerase
MQKLKYAVHAYAWTPSWSNQTLHLIDRARRLGFDIIEIPLMELELVDAKAIRSRAEEVGIGLCTSTACSEANDPTGDDEATRRRGVEYLLACIRATADMGATVFTGVTYSAIGRRISAMPGEQYWERAASALRQAARYAEGLGVTVGIEPINRYETFLVNTCDQAVRLKEIIGEPNVSIHLDAYHMNIEEADFYQPTRKAAPYLCHYHLSESHRGTPGTGRVDWDGIYRALAEADYTGMVGMESFSEVSGAMAAATCIWRKLSGSSDELLSEGLRFLKGLETKYYDRPAKAAQVSPGTRHG